MTKENSDDVITARQMRDLEQAAIASGRVSGLELMERAGKGTVAAVLDHWENLRQGTHRAVVLCGPGNNGGDGFVVARLLAERGWDVDLLFHSTADRLPPDARVNHDLWQREHPVLPLTPERLAAAPPADLYIDALFGIGLSRPVEGVLGQVLQTLAAHRDFYAPRLIAVDIPSGLDADSGEIPGGLATGTVPPCPHCALTVTFHAPKRGHFRARGLTHCGELVIVDIGL